MEWNSIAIFRCSNFQYKAIQINYLKKSANFMENTVVFPFEHLLHIDARSALMWSVPARFILTGNTISISKEHTIVHNLTSALLHCYKFKSTITKNTAVTTCTFHCFKQRQICIIYTDCIHTKGGVVLCHLVFVQCRQTCGKNISHSVHLIQISISRDKKHFFCHKSK